MIVHTMTPHEMLLDARQDIFALNNKVKPIAAEIERKHRKLRDRSEFFETLVQWRSPRGNNWLLLLRTAKRGSTLTMLVWYRGSDTRLRAMKVDMLNDSTTIHLSAHLLDRYLERFDAGRDPLQRLSDFFMANANMAIEAVEDLGGGRHKVVCGMLHGLALGEGDTNTRTVHLNTFVDYGLLGDEQLELAEALDFRRHLNLLSKGQKNHLMNGVAALLADEQARGITTKAEAEEFLGKLRTL